MGKVLELPYKFKVICDDCGRVFYIEEEGCQIYCWECLDAWREEKRKERENRGPLKPTE